MAAVRRLPQRHRRADLVRRRQAGCRHEGVVARVEQQRGHADARQVRPGRRALPVVEHAGKAVQWRGVGVIEVVERARAGHALAVEQPRVARPLGERLGLHRAQEMRRVEQAVEAAANGQPAGLQVQRRADRGQRGHRRASRAAGLLGPAQQRVAAQRDADRVQRPAVARAQALEQPADLGVVARVVGARRQVGLARAAAKMRHRVGPAGAARPVGEGQRIAAARGALEPVQQHQQRRACIGGVEEVDVDEIAVGGGPALAPVVQGGAGVRAAQQRRPDRLQVAAGQPRRRAVRRGHRRAELGLDTACA